MTVVNRTIRLSKNTASSLNRKTGTVGELYYDSDNQTIRIMTGSDSGGFSLASQSWVTTQLSTALTNNLQVGGTIAATSGWAGTTSAAGILGGIPMSFICERNGTGAVGQVMSYGNGSSTGKGLVMPYSGKMIMTVLTGINITGTVTLDLYKNGETVSGYTLTGTATAANVTQQRTTSVAFNAGDRLGWYITTAPSIANCFQVNYYIIYD